MTVSSVLGPIVGSVQQATLGGGAGEYVPPAPSIAAPLDVTWVDGTNPVECVMNVKWTGTGAVEVGDIPQVRYNGGGTIYDGDAVTVLAGNPTFSGLPTQPSGTGYAQYRYVRDPGGPGEVIGAWSSASEGTFDIEAAGYEAESEAIFAAFTTPPDDTRKGLIDDYVLALKTAGVWSKLDCLYVFAAADSQASLINWKSPGTYNATIAGTMTFAADRGHTGNGSSGYINSNFNPSTAPSPNFAQNSAMFGGRSLSTGAANSGERLVGNNLAGVGRTVLVPRNAGDIMRLAINDTFGDSGVANGNRDGHFVGNRSASNAVQYYRNGSALGSNSVASAGLVNTDILFGRDNTSYTTMQIACGFIGGSLTAGEIADLAAADLAYMQAVGAA